MKGFKIYADTTILCDHIGNRTFNVNNVLNLNTEKKILNITDRLKELSNQRLLPHTHVNYLKSLSISPKIIYDIGACVLHWTNEAKQIWPNAEYVVFEAMPECEFLYKENNLQYHIGLLSDKDNKVICFYQNTYHPGGNSYYRENIEVNAQAHDYFNDGHKKYYTTVTLDNAVKLKKLPLPDLIKMDVQGAELDVLKGAEKVLKHCKDLILELQFVEYNKGAPLKDEVINYVEQLGFKLISGPFCDNGPDGDYHFSKTI
jgi:FkbM family methyltransferase